MTSDGAAPAIVRVVTWNVRSLRDDVAVVARSLVRLQPQIVLLQESPRLWWGDRRLASLAAQTELTVVAGGAKGHGVAVLAGVGVRADQTIVATLSRTPRMHRRAVVLAHLYVAGAEVVAGSAHLGLSHVERLRHVGEIAELLDDVAGDVPRVVGLDTNEAPGAGVGVAVEAAWGLREVLVDAPSPAATYPARSPRQRIDQIWVTPRISVRRAGVPLLPLLPQGSDHLPVVADLAVPDAPGERAGWVAQDDRRGEPRVRPR